VTTLSLCDPRTTWVPDEQYAVAIDPAPIVGALSHDERAVGGKLDALARAAVDGDRDAIEDVLRRIRPFVMRYCRSRLGGQDKTSVSADDVAQEVCLAVLTALPNYRDQGRPFLAFVYGIAAHKVADARRSAARNRVEPVSEVPENSGFADGPEAQLMRSESAERMARLLGTLPDKQRDILVLRVVVGLSAEKTAAAVGSTPGAVRVAQHRALNRLRTVLKSTARTDYGSRARLHATAMTDKVTENIECFTGWMSEGFRYEQAVSAPAAKVAL
jgi:RNA polymerase sigma-70 factor, ECF subfamily